MRANGEPSSDMSHYGVVGRRAPVNKSAIMFEDTWPSAPINRGEQVFSALT